MLVDPSQTRERRSVTAWLARNDLDLVDLPVDEDEPTGHYQTYAAISSTVSRTISNNDAWITAGSVMHGHTLITQDKNLQDQLDTARTRTIGASTTLEAWLTDRGKHLDVAYCART